MRTCSFQLPARTASLLACVESEHFSAPRLETLRAELETTGRLPSAELEALYPELVRLDGGGPIGRHACGYCRAIFAAELGACPACGAKV